MLRIKLQFRERLYHSIVVILGCISCEMIVHGYMFGLDFGCANNIGY